MEVGVKLNWMCETHRVSPSALFRNTLLHLNLIRAASLNLLGLVFPDQNVTTPAALVQYFFPLRWGNAFSLRWRQVATTVQGTDLAPSCVCFLWVEPTYRY